MKTMISLCRKWKHHLPPAAMLLSCLALTGASALAQNAKLELSQLDKLASKASQVANVSLEGPMLKLAAEQMQQKASTSKSAKQLAAADMIQRLKGIYVRNFEFATPGGYTKADLDSVMNQLQSGGWKPMVHVEEKKSGETTGIYVMEEGGQVVGMAVVAAEPKELTVVNLVGPIDFSQLGSLGNLGGLGSLGAMIGNSTPQLAHRPDAKPNPDSNPPGASK